MESIRRIIVPTDFSPLSQVALESALLFARKESASIHLLHVIRLPFFHTTYDENVPEAVWEGLRATAQEEMDAACRRLEEAGVGEVGQIISQSLQPAEAIEHAVREIDADLVVMATHGRRGLKHAFLGSLAERTIRSAPVPVLAVKGDGFGDSPPARILLATDFSDHAKRAAQLAQTIAERFAAHVDIVHVVRDTPDTLVYGLAEVVAFENRGRSAASKALEEVGKQLKDAGLSAETHLCEGIAADVITEEAGRLGSDLVVMGTHGHTGIEHVVLGSVTERTLRLAPCSVLTTRTA